jgi:trimeric autotransporter adhesin
LLRNWTLTPQLTTGSGTPFTPTVPAPARGTGLTGTVRGSLTGVTTDAPEGYYLNPAAYSIPAPGQWGNAGRNSVSGPSQFNLNAGVTRTFPWGSRVNVEWRLDATNVLNRVTFASVESLVTSQSFGLPSTTNTMRKLTSTVRLRF